MLGLNLLGAHSPQNFFVAPPAEIGPLVSVLGQVGRWGSRSVQFLGRDGIAVYTRNVFGKVTQSQRFLFAQACQVHDNTVRVGTTLRRQVQFVDAARKPVFELGWDALTDAAIQAFLNFRNGSGRSARAAA